MCESKIIVQLISAEVHRLRVYECEISDLTPVSLRNSQQPLKGLTGKARWNTPNSTPVVLRCPPRDRTRRRLLSALLSRPGRPSLTSIATYYRDRTCSFSPLWPIARVSFLQKHREEL